MVANGPKTLPTGVAVADFIASVADPRRRDEAAAIDRLHRRATGCEPTMWGPSIVGYGIYHYKYASGREGIWMRGGFSPRKAAMTIYLMGIYSGERKRQADALFARLGPHSTGRSCLYLKRLDAVDLEALEELVRLSWDQMLADRPD